MQKSTTTYASVNLDALKTNINLIKTHSKNSEVIAVIKANAYGHGAVPVARFLESIGVNYFAVARLSEALELRRNNIDGKILILGYTPPESADILAENNISQAVFSEVYATELSKNLTKPLNVHIKLNTGMNRLGFNCTDNFDLDGIISTLKLKNLMFEGIFTHFATADRSGDITGEFTQVQYSRFKNACESLKSHGFTPEIRHCSNSAAAILNGEMEMDAVRLGIAMYGLKPDRELDLPDLQPVLEFKTTVAQVKKLKQGEGVSYGLTYKAEKDMKIATLAAGYADGVPRVISSKGRVLIGGEYCEILGRVCMDQMVVDVTNVKSVKMGDTVTLLGCDNGLEITADEWATIANTINYEIVCDISHRVPRYYTLDGKFVE